MLLLFGGDLCCLLLLLLRVVASRRAASLEPQLSKILWANLFATAVDFYGLAQLIFRAAQSPFLVSYRTLAESFGRGTTALRLLSTIFIRRELSRCLSRFTNPDRVKRPILHNLLEF